MHARYRSTSEPLPVIYRNPSNAAIMENNVSIEIPNLDPTQTVVIPISPDQKYHNGEFFQALLHSLNAKGVKVIIIIADELRRHNFQVEHGEESPEADIVKLCVRKLKESWAASNLGTEKNPNAVVNQMKKNGKLEVYQWDEFKAKYAALFKDSTQKVNTAFKDDAEYRQYIETVVDYIFKKNVLDKISANAIIRNFLEKKGEAYIKNILLQYALEESAVIEILFSQKPPTPPVTQMAYPYTFHKQSDEKTISELVFDATKMLSKNPRLVLLDILFKTQKSANNSPRKSGNPDLSAKENMIALLKQKIRALQTEVDQLKTKHSKLIRENQLSNEVMTKQARDIASLEKEKAERDHVIEQLKSHIENQHQKPTKKNSLPTTQLKPKQPSGGKGFTLFNSPARGKSHQAFSTPTLKAEETPEEFTYFNKASRGKSHHALGAQTSVAHADEIKDRKTPARSSDYHP